jgi:formylmethanofuran dehydrogenase subunit E
MSYEKYPRLDEAVSFHGHICPGLAIGYRAVLAGLKRLEAERAGDEELVAIVENDSCSVDAVQVLAGATFGKGNLIFRDWGKQVFTFFRRGRTGGIRVALRWQARQKSSAAEKAGVIERVRAGTATPEEREAADRWRASKIEFLLDAPDEELFEIREVAVETPAPAQIRGSVRCDRCKEQAMETRLVSREGKRLCLDCAGAES